MTGRAKRANGKQQPGNSLTGRQHDRQIIGRSMSRTLSGTQPDKQPDKQQHGR